MSQDRSWAGWGIPVVLCLVASLVADDLLDLLLQNSASNLEDQVKLEAESRLINKLAELRGNYVSQCPEYRDIYDRAFDGVRGFATLAWAAFGVPARVVGALPVIGILAAFSWWVPLLIIALLLPLTWLNVSTPLRVWRLMDTMAEHTRRAALLRDINVRNEYLADIRHFNAAALFSSAWHRQSDHIISSRLRLRNRQMAYSMLCGILSFGLLSVPLIVTIRQAAATNSYTQLVLVLSSILLLRTSVWVLLANGKDLVEAISGTSRWMVCMHTNFKDTHVVGGKAAAKLTTQGIALEHVSFTYPSGQQVFTDLNVEFAPGQSVALVGLNGAGKTTLTRLLTRLVQPDSGTITWNGTPIDRLDVESLRSRMAVVSQDFVRLSVSLRTNLTMGKIEISDDACLDGLRRVGLGHMANTDYLDAPLTRSLAHGVELSGGQWQRLAIARALLRSEQAEVFLWDEPTAALDPTTESDVVRILLEESAGKTTVIVTHRLGICTQVDRVVVLDGGRVSQDGTHAELFATEGLYRSWFQAQAEFYDHVTAPVSVVACSVWPSHLAQSEQTNAGDCATDISR